MRCFLCVSRAMCCKGAVGGKVLPCKKDYLYQPLRGARFMVPVQKNKQLFKRNYDSVIFFVYLLYISIGWRQSVKSTTTQ